MKIKVLLFMGISAFAVTSAYAGNWYDYGNGLINLDLITRIDSKMTVTLVLKELVRDANGTVQKDAKGGEIHRTVVLADTFITEDGVDSVIDGVKKYTGRYEGIQANATLMFDSQVLTLATFESSGLPANDDGLAKLAESWLTDFQKVKKSL
jgi:hypothetical protein